VKTTRGVQRIATERVRQIEDEGYTDEHDEAHRFSDGSGHLAMAAVAYAVASYGSAVDAAKFWPWRDGFKPKDRMANLTRAGALIAAELDRLLAADESETPT
jgi:hypothetical protein